MLRKSNKPSCDIIDHILFSLKLRDKTTKDEGCRRFVACIIKAVEHPGHCDLANIFKHTLECTDLRRIQEILDKVQLPSFPSPFTSPLYSLVPFYQQVDTLEEESSVESENVSYSSASDSISERVLRLSDEIRKYLNVKEVVNQTLLSDDIDFLRKKEHKHVLMLRKNNRPSCDIIDHILFTLKLRDKSTKDNDFRRFVACIVKAVEHPGHWDLAYIFSHMLECKDLEQIQEILGKVQLPPLPSPCTSPPLSPILIRRATIEFSRPEKPVPLITLEGQLVDCEFVETETKLWFAFSSGNYEQVKVLAENIQLQVQCGVYNKDCKIVAMWFESLIMMHRDGMYDHAIQLLLEAERLSNTCENEYILKGRIHQRMAQNYLMMSNRKTDATKYFKMAKEELQFVGRGYDKTNMYCREANILSATEPHRRDDIEKVYEKALGTLKKDDPYFLASFPSVSLSKVAFHLHFAFGAEPYQTYVSAEDIKKAKDTLRNLNEEEHILIDMRQKEYDFLVAELCRLERNYEEAHSRFRSIICTADSKAKKLLRLAGHRIELCESHMSTYSE